VVITVVVLVVVVVVVVIIIIITFDRFCFSLFLKGSPKFGPNSYTQDYCR